MNKAPKYPMRLVVRRTGLSPYVIRVWEKRYGAVSPQRTTTNRGLYSDADIERLRMLRRATLAGQSIGQIARLAPEQLRALIALDEAHAARVTAASEALPIRTHAVPYVDAVLAAVERLDAAAFETMLARAAVIFSPQMVVEEVIVPLLYELGDLWHKGALWVTHEHLASAVIRTTLGQLSRGFAPWATARRLVVTTSAGQLHELGALIIATVAAADGWGKRSIWGHACPPWKSLQLCIPVSRKRSPSASCTPLMIPTCTTNSNDCDASSQRRGRSSWAAELPKLMMMCWPASAPSNPRGLPSFGPRWRHYDSPAPAGAPGADDDRGRGL